jgi:hypothetical protein
MDKQITKEKCNARGKNTRQLITLTDHLNRGNAARIQINEKIILII